MLDVGFDAPTDLRSPDTLTDADRDGVPANADCDDSNPSLGAIANDADCDGVLTVNDCDDKDPKVGSKQLVCQSMAAKCGKIRTTSCGDVDCGIGEMDHEFSSAIALSRPN